MPYGSLLVTLSAPGLLWMLAHSGTKLFMRLHLGPLDHPDRSVRFSLQRGCIQPQQLPTPPHPVRTFLCHCREPVLPEHRADLSRRLLRKRIASKKGQHILVTGKEPQLRVRHDRILAPGTQGCEPQVPIEPRLIRRVDSRWFIQILRLVAKWVSLPALAIR